MKFFYRLLFLPVFILAFTGCGKDEDDDDIIVVNNDDEETTYVEPYHSLDIKTDDGKVTQLQKHKVGKGVPIVIMGDGFVDKDIKEGKFREVTNKALEALFSKHPLKSLRDYFDVYEVTAVSYHASSAFWDIMDLSTFKTAFSVGVAQEYPNSVYIGKLNTGDEKKIKEYAKKAIDGNKINDVTIVMLVNDIFTGGITSYSTYLFTTGYMDVPTGCGISYVTLSDIMRPHDDAQYALTLLHEFGHGFAKLADEYVSDERKWYDLESGKDNLILYQNSGYNRNVSLESDVTKTPWADFAADSRYDFEKLGCYEGGEYQATGVYRATESSIMDGGWGFSRFNVASRVMIYKRCMRLAYGDSWEFNYEDFVKFDLEKAKAENRAYKERYPTYYAKSMRFCAPPRFVDSVIRSRAIKTTK